MQPMTARAVGPVSDVGPVALRDFVALAKPRITLMVVITAAAGLFLAHRSGQAEGPGPSATTVLGTLTGLALIVAGANALNMYIERDVDRRMSRTARRPLPAGRMPPAAALWFGIVSSVCAVPLILVGSNALTAALAVAANLLYVLAYTPLKQRSHYALHVGAVPGAIPPLLGWTAATGRVDRAGLVLFAILFLWQIPHFLAITLFRKGDYARAGIYVMPNQCGELNTRHAIVRWTFALVAVSFFAVPLGLAGRGYLAVAALLGAAFFVWGCWGLREQSSTRWAKSLFGVSIVYLLLVMAALVINPWA